MLLVIFLRSFRWVFLLLGYFSWGSRWLLWWYNRDMFLLPPCNYLWGIGWFRRDCHCHSAILDTLENFQQRLYSHWTFFWDNDNVIVDWIIASRSIGHIICFGGEFSPFGDQKKNVSKSNKGWVTYHPFFIPLHSLIWPCKYTKWTKLMEFGIVMV